MAVMDFREGGYVFSRHKVKREFSYDGGWDDRQQGGSAGPADAQGNDSLTTRFARLTHYLGAVASVALMVGLMVWGWQLVSRDVSGVPVIRAIAGDARTTPSEPGGELTNYTGYAVNTVAEGVEQQPTQQVAIAPAPVGLSDEDVAMGQLGATARDPAVTSEVPLSFAGDPIIPLSDSEARAQAEAEAQRLAMADSAVQDATIIDIPATEGPVNEALTDENGVPAQAAAIAEALVQAQAEANPGVLTASTRPAPRPRSTRVASAGTTATDARPVPPEERPAEAPAARPDASPVAAVSQASGPQVQLGAFDSDSIAASEWNRLMNKHVVFAGKQQVIQQHQSNGRTFWRLRVAGFGSLSEARQFCAALKSAGTDCLALN
ncbi:SPOR domain-containing protein [Paracoccus sediminis]|uniref:SPOR domain-containing protein n=1 Tax=Paracoccus sediminis TaxID=1214787 RepID=A0A238X844_9RHOB|nr:SPOR domain-containing protein [Paracoccus sediminis]TBN49038.1 SPOR domain-containing protein [Paracoccus sediminis]SNR54009.1 Sporulation related domain-containing protein [Paracoccus sediminis]